MFIDIRELEQKPVVFSQSVPAGKIPFNADFEQLTPLESSGRAELQSSTDEIRVQGTLQVTLGMTCDRCAEPFQQIIDQEFDLIYAPPPETNPGAEIAIGPSDSNIAFFEGNGLELNDILQEQVLLAIPLQRLCRADCKGICPTCGQNRNETDCQCRERIVDDRWSALKNL
jgi:uncharacterized protein